MKTASNSAEKLLATGGAYYRSGVVAHAWSDAAKSAGIAYFQIDCHKAKTRSALLSAIEHALELPDHFGHNLDALYDCITDIVLAQKHGMVIHLLGLHEDSEKQKNDNQAVTQVFEDAIEFATENHKRLLFVVD